MTDLLKAVTTPSTTAEQSPVAEEARVEPSDCVDGARRASPVNKACAKGADAPLKGWIGSWRCRRSPLLLITLSEEGIEATTPLLWMMLS